MADTKDAMTRIPVERQADKEDRCSGVGVGRRREFRDWQAVRCMALWGLAWSFDRPMGLWAVRDLGAAEPSPGQRRGRHADCLR